LRQQIKASSFFILQFDGWKMRGWFFCSRAKSMWTRGTFFSLLRRLARQRAARDTISRFKSLALAQSLDEKICGHEGGNNSGTDQVRDKGVPRKAFKAPNQKVHRGRKGRTSLTVHGLSFLQDLDRQIDSRN
jgi:hypothetical protein